MINNKIFLFLFLIILSLEILLDYNINNIQNFEIKKNAVLSLYRKLNWFENSQLSYDPYLVYSDIEKRNENFKSNKFKIGLLGGSVANNLFKDLTKRNIKCNEKNVKFYNLAVGGYRQPQQLISSILHFNDINLFISVEGFNDLLGRSFSCHKDYWNYQAQRFDKSIKTNKYHFLLKFSKSVFNFYYLMSKYSNIVNYFLLQTINPLKNYLNFLKKKMNIDYASDCRVKHKKNDQGLKYLFLQHKILRNSDKDIFTFLQPNQYVKGSKIFTNKELTTFKLWPQEIKDEVNSLYKNGRDQIKVYKRIIDMTQIFKKTKQTVYIDECCHINRLGNKLILDFIIDNLKGTCEPL